MKPSCHEKPFTAMYRPVSASRARSAVSPALHRVVETLAEREDDDGHDQRCQRRPGLERGAGQEDEQPGDREQPAHLREGDHPPPASLPPGHRAVSASAKFG
jgi:hypothetical protein